MLSFEDDIADFSCISTALKNLGYDTRWTSQNGVEYHSYELGVSATFWYAQIQQGDDLDVRKNRIVHSVSFGSAPAACSSVKSAGELITKIEFRVLAACKLDPIDTKEEIRCKK